MTPNRTKILATIGPACQSAETLQSMVEAGVNLFRVNLSHGTLESKREILRLVKTLSSPYGDHPAILADLAGPKIRVTSCPDNFNLEPGQEVVISNDLSDPAGEIFVTPGFTFRTVHPGAQVAMLDGLLQLRITKQISPHALRCVTLFGGLVEPRKGVNFPGIEIDLAPLSAQDIADLKMVLEEGVDWVALSFVRRASDLRAVEAVFQETGLRVPVIAKIEKWEAISDLSNIIRDFDAVMVARGDLGSEIPGEQVPIVQKKIVREANLAGKPSIIATQILESMIVNPVPTRAEVSDIANAIFDGVDALLVTGETAIGHHPLEVIQTLRRVIVETECNLDFESPRFGVAGTMRLAESIAESTCNIARELKLPAIVTMTHTGSTARMISLYRPSAKILALTPFLNIARRVSLYWGVFPYIVREYQKGDDLPHRAKEVLSREKLLNPGERFVITAGVPVGVPGTTNFLSVQTLD